MIGDRTLEEHVAVSTDYHDNMNGHETSWVLLVTPQRLPRKTNSKSLISDSEAELKIMKPNNSSDGPPCSVPRGRWMGTKSQAWL